MELKYQDVYLEEYHQDLIKFKTEVEAMQKSFHNLAYIGWKSNRSAEHPLNIFAPAFNIALLDIGKSLDAFSALTYAVIPGMTDKYKSGMWLKMNDDTKIQWFLEKAVIAENQGTRTGKILSSLQVKK
jgi:hypothetical protein